ncbi:MULTISPECIES: IclR family transcriptional regulator [Neobacillus]|uniref:IclR family transcriptional regulator n=1 Tax=Neobacillus rhizophilus TaxID=2833579 RepID=A0A942U4I0_9BACI|nr:MULTISPECIES: IclR family transcriptional regulator [Neobacillus]MBS4211414.1 IclR family transcriptional regulator [Neobacillus rhizophilus]MBU8916832.1 IclR family transcriptional regulator [Bacillus sp. FJAT-29953]
MESQKMKEKRKYSVPAIENAMEILKLLSRNRFRESTVTEIANALSLNPATCYRILQSLEEFSMVRYLENKKRYTLGPYLVVLGERAKEHLDYLSIIMPYLEKLTRETGMTSILVNKIGEDKVAIVAKVEASDFGVSVSVGRHFSITDGSFGMCFLAPLDQQQREHFLKQQKGLKTFSEEEVKTIERDMEFIRENGYSITYGEYIKGLGGIAAPIFSGEDTVEMSIELICFTSQFDKEDLHLKGILVKRAAEDISNRIRNLS